jgi:ABC-type Zn uptake system ZnuABC Zn-binding protein ZnuA
MKRLLLTLLLCLSLLGCTAKTEYAQVAATTLPVYEFASYLCEGTPVTVARLITEEVSCLHDYSLNVRQVKAAEAADVIVISGAGLEEFLEDLLADKPSIDASAGIELMPMTEGHSHDHDENHADAGHEGHSHEHDPHIWLSVPNAMTMAQNICDGLTECYPEYASTMEANLTVLLSRLEALHTYAEENLSSLQCRELITFHDGFGYLAHTYHLEIIRAVEEESGSEASARDLIELIEEVEHHSLPAIFTERSGTDSAASIIARETGADCFSLDMAMAGDSYFEAMYHNIDTLKEALQ